MNRAASTKPWLTQPRLTRYQKYGTFPTDADIEEEKNFVI